MANQQAPAIVILGRVCVPSFDVTGFLSMRHQWFTFGFFVLLCAQLLEEVNGWIFSYAAASTLWRRRSNPARPYMERLMGLQPVDLSLDRTSAPGQCQSSMYGIAILTQAPGKALEAAIFSG